MPESRWRKLSAVRSAVRIEASDPTTLATSSPGSMRAPSGNSAEYSQGGRTISNTRAAAAAPLRTPRLLATTCASPTRSEPTTACVVMSMPCSPRSSWSATATSRSSSAIRCAGRSGFDETIGLLAQSKCLLGETEEDGSLAAHTAFLAGRLDDAAVDDPTPEIAAIDRETEHRLVHVLELGDRELRGQQLEADRGVPHLAAQAAHRVVDNLAMVEGHLHGQPADGVPLLQAFARALGARFGQCRRNDGDVGDGQNVAPRVPPRDRDMPAGVDLLRPVKCLELIDQAAFDPGDGSLLGSRLCVERDAGTAQAPGERPEAGIRRLRSLGQKNAQLPAGQSENCAVDGNRSARHRQPVGRALALHDSLRHPMLHLISVSYTHL